MTMEIGGFFGLVLLGLNIWAIISILGSAASNGAKALWILLIFVLPFVGFVIWLVAGPRSQTSSI